jgi:hypothetical protein
MMLPNATISQASALSSPPSPIDTPVEPPPKLAKEIDIPFIITDDPKR